jgi:hypothetical protein
MRSELPVSTRTARRGDKLPEPGKLPELRLNYGPVEKALAAIYAATEDDIRRKAFRARINFFQRAKVLGNEAGKGQRNAYSIVQIGRWLACLELTELGLSPTTAGELIAGHWDAFEPIFRDAQASALRDPGPDDIVLCIGGVHLMSGSWAPKSGFPGVPSIQGCTLRKLPDRVMVWMWMTASDPAAPRLLIVNLSERLRQFHNALGNAHTEDLIAARTAGKIDAPADLGAGGKRKRR